VLILDEPTNHLDIPSREALEAALDEYDGTIITVSHDRFFLDKISTQILAFEDTGVDIFNGNYTEYHDWREDRDAERGRRGDSGHDRPSVLERAQPAFSEGAANDTALSKNQLERLEKRIAAIENRIQVLEGELAKLSAELGRPEVSADYARLQKASRQFEEKDKETNELYDEWESCVESRSSAA
jgi:ATP-binding cassette, subfamily F, member 3